MVLRILTHLGHSVVNNDNFLAVETKEKKSGYLDIFCVLMWLYNT